MKSGMVMMIESMGIDVSAVQQLLDPNNIKELLTKVETMCNSIEEIKQSVLRVEIKLGTIPEPIAMKLLEDGETDAYKQTVEFVRNYNGDNRNGSSDNGNSTVNRDASIIGIGNGR